MLFMHARPRDGRGRTDAGRAIRDGEGNGGRGLRAVLAVRVPLNSVVPHWKDAKMRRQTRSRMKTTKKFQRGLFRIQCL